MPSVGLTLETNEELYKWFTQQVMKNLHVVYTMNPSSDGLKDRAATSPALFIRCVLNCFGDWSDSAFFQAPDYFPVSRPTVPGPRVHAALPPKRAPGLDIWEHHSESTVPQNGAVST